jgi:asparagine synthase (glutamine-hydrolysing)
LNLFVLGWNADEQFARAAIDVLRRMSERFPQLDPDTLWSRRYNGAFAASMHTSRRASLPRSYVFHGEHETILWDGICVSRTGSFKAHRAEELGQYWHSLCETLEGQFVVARIAEEPLAIEVITDPLGMLNVYYATAGETCLISNSVEVLELLLETRTWDPLGVSTFVTLGWAGSDQTLCKEVKVIPGGHYWIWEPIRGGLRKQIYYSLTNLPRWRKSSTHDLIRGLGDSLVELCQHVFGSYGPLTGMLTGGQDSRVIAALLTAGKTQPSFTTGAYFKDGQPWDDESARDVEIACTVANILGSPHRVNVREAEALINWDTVARKWVRRYDGLRSLCDLIDDAYEPQTIQHLPIYIGGAGGEIARGFYSIPEMLKGGIDEPTMAHLLIQRCFRRPRKLFHQNTIELVEQYFLSFVLKMIKSGLPMNDVADAFYAYERCRRFIGSAQQIHRATMDRFHPLCSRPWLEAAFTLQTQQRCTGILHQQLIRLLAPPLQSVPFDKPPKADSTTNRQQKKIDRRAWLLKTNLGRIRETCFDQASSFLWEFIDRETFEQLSAPETCEQANWPYWQTSVIYDVATMFYYSSA